MKELKKGHKFAIQSPAEKQKMCVRLFFVLMLHIKFQVPSSSGSLVLQPTKGVTDRWRDRQTDGPKPICRSGNILSFLLPLFQEGQLSVTGDPTYPNKSFK